MKRPSKLATFLAAMAIAFGVTSASAREVQVKMLNKGETGLMVFEPAFVTISPGDVVRFVAVNPGHNAESIAKMIPTGAKPFKTPLNVDATVRFTVPGLYGYKCLPHFGMGMVGIIQVRAASSKAALSNQAAFIAATAKLPALAKKKMMIALPKGR